MKLGERQEIHTDSIGKLICHINSVPGYRARIKGSFCPDLNEVISALEEFSFDSALLNELKLHKHCKRSFHYSGRATDIDIFYNGTWLTDTADYKFAGDYWESLHPLNTWGGRWSDGRHFSTGEGK